MTFFDITNSKTKKDQGYTRKNWIAYKAKDVRSAFMNFMKQI